MRNDECGIEKAFNELMSFLIHHSSFRIHRFYFSVSHVNGAVGELCGEVAVVCDHEDGQFVMRNHFAEKREEFAGAGRVEIAGRLVSEEHARAIGECAGDGDALLLAARKFRRAMVTPLAKPDAL